MAEKSAEETAPLLDSRPLMKRYYELAESRLGYKLLLGDARHFAYYESANEWPWPVGAGLRRMEQKLFERLDLSPGSRVLDCGCGYGLVAMYMARHGLRVQAIDFMPRHVDRSRRRIAAAGLSDVVDVQRADYHHLEHFADSSFDGAYTCETFVHAVDPVKALRGWYRLLRPGGTLVMSEYAWKDPNDPKHPKHLDRVRLRERVETINLWSDMPSFRTVGEMPGWVREAGFEDVRVIDITDNVVPMMWLFWLLALVPYFFVQLFRIESHFPNVVAGVEMYRARGDWEFFHLVARKPERAR